MTGIAFCVGMATFAHAHDSPLKVEIETTHAVKDDQSFEINTKIRNTGSDVQTVRVLSCAYPRHWSSDNPDVNVQQVPCRIDGLVNIRIIIIVPRTFRTEVIGWYMGVVKIANCSPASSVHLVLG